MAVRLVTAKSYKAAFQWIESTVLARRWPQQLGATVRKKFVFFRYLAGLASTFAGAWLSSVCGSMIPLAMGASVSLMCTASLVRQIWTRRVRARDGHGGS